MQNAQCTILIPRSSFCVLHFAFYNCIRAGVAELVDAQDLKSCAFRGVRVRFPPSAPIFLGIGSGVKFVKKQVRKALSWWLAAFDIVRQTFKMRQNLAAAAFQSFFHVLRKRIDISMSCEKCSVFRWRIVVVDRHAIRPLEYFSLVRSPQAEIFDAKLKLGHCSIDCSDLRIVAHDFVHYLTEL